MSAAWALVLLFLAPGDVPAPQSAAVIYMASKDVCEAALHDYEHRPGLEAHCHVLGPGSGDFGYTPILPTPRKQVQK